MFSRKRKNVQDTPKIVWHVPEGTGDFLVPKRATDGSMAYDIVAPMDYTIPPISDPNIGKAVVIDTLIAATIPRGYAAILGSRSSMASKNLITVEGGWIDSDFLGVWKVILYNHGTSSYKINSGDRIAQVRFVKVIHLEEEVCFAYPDKTKTKRGDGGLGSTGR